MRFKEFLSENIFARALVLTLTIMLTVGDPFLASTAVAYAAALDETHPAGMEEFAQKMVAALRGGSFEDYKKLIHPDCPESKSLNARINKTLSRSGAPVDEYSIEVFAITAEEQAKNAAYLPVNATHQLSIHGQREKEGKTEPRIWSYMVAEKNGDWYNIFCLNKDKN